MLTLTLRAVFFDKDGVLADTEPYHAQAYALAFGDYGVAIQPAEFRQAVTLDGRRAVDWFRELGGQAPTAELRATKDRHYGHLIGGREEPREGLFDLVADLKRANISLYVATSARRVLAERLLEQFGLRDQFSGILGLEDVKAIKPDPEVYHKAIALAGVKPEEAVVLEDMPRGIVAARRAGLVAVAIPTEPRDGLDFGEANLVVDSLAALSAARLQQLLEQVWGRGGA